MFPITQIPSQRRKRKAQTDKRLSSRLGRLGWGCSALFGLGIAFSAIIVAIIYADLSRDLPSVESLPALLESPDGPLFHPTRLYDRTGKNVLLILQNPSVTERHYLKLETQSLSSRPLKIEPPSPDTLPLTVAAATVAYNEPDYWQRPALRLSLGAEPGLAEQLVNDWLLSDEPSSWRRTLRSQLLAAQILSRYGRAKILEWYLNVADYGNYAFGADEAARAYLGKAATDLNLAEAALLAAVSAAPTLNPWDAPQIALERQKEVIQSMLKQGWITSEQAQQALTDSVTINPPPAKSQYFAPAFTQLVLEQLSTQINKKRIEFGGWRILTTLDYQLQTQAECALRAWLSPIYLANEGTACEAARLLPTRLLEQTTTSENLRASIVIHDPQRGQILALVGETTSLDVFDPSEGHTADFLTAHPPGTLLTPIIYLTSFTRGFGPASLVWDIPGQIASPLETLINPNSSYHGPMRLRMALANDYLIPALHLYTQLGPAMVWHIVHQLSMTSTSPSLETVTTGSPLEAINVTLLEITTAYGVFANQGTLVGSPGTQADATLQPWTILQVTDSQGNIWMDCQAYPDTCGLASQTVVSPQLAYLITHVLSDEAARWPSLGHPNVLEIGYPTAAKLGYTTEGDSVWTVGYTPQLVVATWVGISKTPDAKQELSLLLAAGLWRTIMQYTNQEIPPQSWPIPPGISTLEVCETSGLLPTSECPTTTIEVFLAGNEPVYSDNLYRTFLINRETGLLATVFTPSELIEERVYLVVPPEATAWAEEANLSSPPDSYDVIYLPPKNPDTSITSPEMFAYVSSKVTILGTANGEDFQSYNIQIGQGLNPLQWLQLGDVHEKPVNNDVLGFWDTQGLDGLYALRLQVLRQNQRLDTAIIQVTVDNQPPDLTILSPKPGQQFIYPHEQTVQIQIQSNDNYALAGVTFILDGIRLAQITKPPFTLPWQGSLGEHTLRIIAEDYAGNIREDQVTFTIRR
ncbi:MAG: penicillin-binding protein [Chloroflexota bacterium]